MRWLGAALALIITACGQGPDGLGVVANSPGTLEVGQQRVLVGYISEEGDFLADPDLGVRGDFYFGEESDPRLSTPGVFLPTIPGARGIYRFDVEFDRAGTWTVVLHPDGAPSTIPSPFLVVDQGVVPGPGDPAPASITATAVSAELEDITTDPDPDPSFYQLSIDEAVTSGSPSVIVFATPAFCTSATCGPTLDVVKAVSAGYQDVAFIHVEVFANLDAATFEELVVVPAVLEWQLPSEPWVFVVDAGGVITAAFEGTVAEEELIAALESVG